MSEGPRKRVGRLIEKPLSTEQFEELRRVMSDPFFFSTFINVVHPIRGKVPFKLYPYQKRTLWYFLTERFNIVLKFRQAGLTELIAMYCLWLAMYHSNKNILIISIKEIVAKKVLRKIKYMYRNLHDHLKVAIINGREENFGTSTEMEFANGSIIASIPTTPEAGRSEGLTLMVIDEAAIIKWANTIWASAYPTLSTGGAAIVNSTPYGVGNWYHNLWVEACSGGNDFNAIRLKWQMHPERDQAWYDLQRSALGPKRTAQEIDGEFLTSGDSVFDLEDIRAIEESLSEYPPIEVHERGSLLVFKKPLEGEKYWLAGDIASGRSRDYTTFTIFNGRGEEYAAMKARISIGKAADIFVQWGKKYHNAVIAPESNDLGLGVTSKIEEGGYRNLYYSQEFVRKKGKSKPDIKQIPGWYTTKKNRPIIIGGLEDDIRNDVVIIKDPFFVQEAYTFIYDSQNRPVAMGKRSTMDNEDMDNDQTYTDDAIIAKCIGNHIRKGKTKGLIVLPR